MQSDGPDIFLHPTGNTCRAPERPPTGDRQQFAPRGRTSSQLAPRPPCRQAAGSLALGHVLGLEVRAHGRCDRGVGGYGCMVGISTEAWHLQATDRDSPGPVHPPGRHTACRTNYLSASRRTNRYSTVANHVPSHRHRHAGSGRQPGPSVNLVTALAAHP